jgi:glutamate-1-semialdehyde 2,1-aminomutase
MASKLAYESHRLYQKARELIPGGVNSPVRAYAPYPLFVASAKGSRFRTVDGEEYLDYCMAYGALLDGHAPTEIVEAVKMAVERGSIYGQPTEMEVELAQLINSLVASVEMVRLVNSGTEATMHALRLARAFTRRNKVLKFEGGFHGSSDSLLVKLGSGGSVVGEPNSEGVLKETAKNTLVAPFNDENMTEKILQDSASEIAAVIVEPVMGNIGPVTPKPGFLETIRKITIDEQILLIFDEVITGFRLALGGAQEYYSLRPDLTVLGKILGGGFPLAAFGGRRDIMEKLAPLGPVYQAGTFSGNPISAAAGITMLQSLRERAGKLYPQLDRQGQELRRGIHDSLESRRVPAQVNGIGSLFQVFFTQRPVTDYHSARSSNVESYQRYFRSMLASKVFVPSSQFETCFTSTAHTDDELRSTLEAIDTALKTVPR